VLPLIALTILLSCLAGCATGTTYNCPAPALKTWGRAQELPLADEVDRARADGRWPMMLRAVLDYARMRREIRACREGR
jgi:hypothetical protein